MRRVVQKSTVLDRDQNGEVVPPFAVYAESGAGEQENSQRRKPMSRFRILIAKLFRNLAYTCLFVGIVAVIGVIVVVVLTYWPNQNVLTTISNDVSASQSYGGGWVWLMLGGLAPGFMWIMGIVFAILAFWLIVWGWRAALNFTKRLVARIANELIKPVALVEAIVMILVWCVAVLGAWWTAEAELFVPLLLMSLAFLVLGLVSLVIFRGLVGSRLDLGLRDLHGRNPARLRENR